MNTPVPTPPSDRTDACRRFRDVLENEERGGSVQDRSEFLEHHARDCPRCRRHQAAHLARLARLGGLSALQGRSLPRGSVEGLYEAVSARLRTAPPGGGMSRAFLDAPRALRLWRTTALAAGFVLAAGVGLFAWGGLGAAGAETPDRSAEVPLHDVRGEVLRPWDDASSAPGQEVFVQSLDFGAPRAERDFFQDPPAAQPVGAQPRWN